MSKPESVKAITDQVRKDGYQGQAAAKEAASRLRDVVNAREGGKK